MSSPSERPRGSADRGLALLRRNLGLLGPILLIVVGAALGFASLEAQVTVPYTRDFMGTVLPGNETLELPAADLVTYIQVNLTRASCGLRAYPANETDAVRFNTTGVLPGSWIDCNARTATVGGDTVALILVNVEPVPMAYEINVRAILIQTPLDWLALPGMVLALAGLLAFVPRFVLHETLHSTGGFGQKRKKK